MNYIWSAIFLSSFLYALLSGRLELFSQTLTESASSSVEFLLGLIGIIALWSGLMEIAERTGLIQRMSRILLPLTTYLFPEVKNPDTISSIVMSFMSNIFGAGNSSTVFALRTMEKLDEDNHRSPIASNAMCTFAVVNMAFAPIFPMVVLNLRMELGSNAPYSIVLPALITSLLTVLVSILACKILERRF